MFKKEIRKNEELLTKILKSSYESLYELKSAQEINSYAACLGFTYPDVQHEYYTPGVFNRLKNGTGPVVTSETDLFLVAQCFQLDMKALNFKYEHVNPSEIKYDDGKYYIGISTFHSIKSQTISERLDFVFRTENDLWLHKPGWIDSIQSINWIKELETFEFVKTCATPSLFPTYLKLFPKTCRGICFPDFFYAIEFPE